MLLVWQVYRDDHKHFAVDNSNTRPSAPSQPRTLPNPIQVPLVLLGRKTRRPCLSTQVGRPPWISGQASLDLATWLVESPMGMVLHQSIDLLAAQGSSHQR